MHGRVAVLIVNRFEQLAAIGRPVRANAALHSDGLGEQDDDIAAARTRAASRPPPLSDASQAAPTLLANRYTIIGLLGAGGMGRVYRAHDKKLDEVVALKMLRRELVGQTAMLERFRQEVKLARKVTSPHVVRTFDLGEHGDEVFLTMEYIEGRSLAQRIDEGPLALDEALRIARAVCAGMAAAHATGVLHRDLKPDNVLLGKDGRIAITDFGIARAASSDPLATVDRFVGTPAYMSPEQVESATTIGPPTDVYSFGTILFEMLTSRRPFVGHEVLAVAVARLLGPPPDPRTLRAMPDDLAALVLRCMARDPSSRFADGAALEAALGSLGGVTSQTIPSGQLPIVPEKSSRSVAIVPLRATGDLAEVAEGLAEEIVDALSMSRGLRVRPLGALRSKAADADPTELGKSLGVDGIVEGSIRRRGDRVRVAARVISVVDAFQLWANHVDAAADGLLAACDEIVRAIAQALTIELALPQRPALAARLAEVYLEAKAHLRGHWFDGDMSHVIAELDRVLPEAPDDPSLLALLATALARSGFSGNTAHLHRSRPLAERAVALAPGSGDAQMALAIAALNNGDAAHAAGAFARAVRIAPGLALAQALLGSLLLDANHLDDAIAHLEASASIDPNIVHITDLARAYCYRGRLDEGIGMLHQLPHNPFVEYLIARLENWRGRRYQIRPTEASTHIPVLVLLQAVGTRTYATGVVTDDDIRDYDTVLAQTPTRWRAAQAQYVAELYASVGLHERAIDMIRISVDAGLHDICWLERCPPLEPLRSRAELVPLTDVVRQRATAIVAAVRDAMA